MTIRVVGAVHVGGGTMLIYSGTPERSVEWRLTGSGTLTPITDYTDHNGQAAALYTPGVEGETVTIEVEAGA